MPKKNRIQKLREFDVKYGIRGLTKTELIEYLSYLELPADATLELSVSEYYGDYEVKAVFEYYTEETDEEYQNRRLREQYQVNAERMQYERLKAKFEGKDK